METLWKDDNGHRNPGPLLAIGVAVDGFAVRVADTVPDTLGQSLRDVVAASTPPADPSQRPSCVERCQALLGPDAELSSGPSYFVPEPLGFSSDAVIVRSDDPRRAILRAANPGNWEAQEWLDLLEGRLGPWAMATRGDRVISICHTPRNAPRGVEAGTWTDQEFRGQGLAAATTAAWSELVVRDGRYVFYSTSADNRSSQGVAARLGLPCIGWIWKVTKPDTP